MLLHLYTGKLPFLGFESLREPVCKMCCQVSAGTRRSMFLLDLDKTKKKRGQQVI